MKNLLCKYRRTGLSLLILVAAAFIYTGCSIESPQSPTWDVNLTVPLITHHYDIYELIDRLSEEALSYDEDGNIMISFTQTLDTLTVDAGLTINDMHDNYAHQLGTLAINPPPPMSASLYLDDYVAITAGTVDQFGFDAGKDFETLAQFESADISEGQLELIITNDLGLNTDSLTIHILNTDISDTITTYICEGGLLSGATLIDTVDIAGSSVTNQLSLASRVHSPGGTLFSVSDKNLSVSAVMLEGVTVTSATAQIPAQEVYYVRTIEFIDENQVSSADISSGHLTIDIQNTSELAGSFSVIINELSHSGQTFEVEVYIPAQGSYQIYHDLAGYQFDPQMAGANMAVDVDLTVALPGSGDNLATVSYGDYFSLDASLNNLEFSRVSGIIAATDVEVETTVEQLNLPTGMEDISLTDAVLTINLFSEVDIPAQISVELNGEAGQYLSFNSEVERGAPGNPGHTQIIITDLSNLTSPVPNEITISGTAIAGDGLSTGTVYLNSKIWGEVEITSPLKFALGETQVDTDLNSTEIDQQDIDEISERLLGGTIHATLTNHLPFGCEVELFFSGDSAAIYSNPQLTIGPITVDGGVINNGLVSQAVVSEIEISLSESDMDIIENPILYIGQNIYLPGTGGQVVSIISSDYLDISAYMTLSTRLGGEWD